MVDQWIYFTMGRIFAALLGRLDGAFGFRHWRSNGNTYQAANCRDKAGAARFQSSASYDSSDKLCTAHTAVIHDGYFCHDRLFISDACSAEVLWTMGTARTYRSFRIYCLGVPTSNIWISEYPCRNWLVETIGKTLSLLFIIPARRVDCREGR